jgi:hypothetical protein
MPHGWIVDPCREVLEVPDLERVVEIAGGDKALRRQCKYGPPIKGGLRVPFGVASIQWQGELP